jgi:catechol 2,3-dioxygenase-like lactoylglutathione lyase family enzyme
MLHHISFGVGDLGLSGAFYDAALGALGFRRVFEDETAVGYGLVDGEDELCLKLRPDYGRLYYAAFLIDPDGHRIEAVTKVPPD